ncbi:Nlpc/p60 superfamily protein, partial [Monkeypox virus]
NLTFWQIDYLKG